MTWTKIGAIINIVALCCGGSATLAAGNGKLAFVRAGNIWIADSRGSGARQLTYSSHDRGPALSPDGKWVAFYSGEGENTGFGQVFMIPSQGGMIRQFRNPQLQGGEHPAFSPDGKGLLFVGLSDLKVQRVKDTEQSFATMSLSLADLGGGTLRQVISHPHALLDAGYFYSNPAFSPDGRLIAFQDSGSDVSGGFEVINLKGKRILRFPRNRRDATPYWRPQFFPDGKEILCYTPATEPGKEDIIYRVNLASGKKTAVALGSNPTFVDQGRAIVYERWPKERWTSGATAKPDLWRIELKAGSVPQMIVTDGAEPAGQMP